MVVDVVLDEEVEEDDVEDVDDAVVLDSDFVAVAAAAGAVALEPERLSVR